MLLEEDLSVKGVLLKRKDFIELDENAQTHPNRHYYFRREEEGTIETCSTAIEVRARARVGWRVRIRMRRFAPFISVS